MPRKLSRRQQRLAVAAERLHMLDKFEAECKKQKLESDQWFPNGSSLSIGVQECVAAKLRGWERDRKQVPTGRYRDEARLRARYQREFVWYIQKDFPTVLKELQAIVPLFENFFGEYIDRHNSVFDRGLMDPFFTLDESFTQGIRSSLPFGLATYRENRYGSQGSFRHGFLWGEYRPLLLFMSLQAKEAKSEQHLNALTRLIQDEISVESSATEHLAQQGFTQEFVTMTLAKSSIEGLVAKGYGPSLADPRLSQFFEGVLPDRVAHRGFFAEMMLEVLDWSERHHLEKEWLLRYAFYFMYQLIKDKNLSIADLHVPELSITDLQAEDFELRVAGWNAGDETREDYQAKLEEAFRDKVENYFDEASRQLGLESLTTQTKRHKIERVRWLVIAILDNRKAEAVLDWLTEEAQSQPTDDTVPSLPAIYAAYKNLRQFGLPEPPK